MSPLANGAWIERAIYSARVDDRHHLRGTASWEIRARETTPSWIPIDNCGLILGKATWENTEEVALIGSNQQGQSILYVPRSGTLNVAWALSGQRDKRGIVKYRFELPDCPINELSIATLSDFDIDVISEPSEVGKQRFLTRASMDENVPPKASAKQTMWALGRHTQFEMRISPNETVKTDITGSYRHETTYQLQAGQVFVSCRFDMDLEQTVSALHVEMDGKMTVSSAEIGEHSLRWQKLTNDKSSHDVQHLVFELNKPVIGSNRILRINAFTPISLGKSRRLPAVRLSKMNWQRGQIKILVPGELDIARLQTQQCRPLQVMPLPGPQQGQQLRFQLDAERAPVTLMVVQRPPSLDGYAGTTIEIGTHNVSATLVADIEGTRGESFELVANIAPDWFVDSVEADEATNMDDWELDTENNQPRLRIRLRRPITGESGLRLTILGHHLGIQPDTTIDGSDIQPIRFQNVVMERNLVCIRAHEPYLIQVEKTTGIRWLDSEELTQGDASRITPKSGDRLFHWDGHDQLYVGLARAQTNLACDVTSDTFFDVDTISENYRIECHPEDANVSRLLVSFSTSRTSDLVWMLEADGQIARVSAHRLNNEDRPQATAFGAETWEVELGHAYGEPFVLVASRTVETESPFPIALVSVGQASRQHGTLMLRAAPGVSLELGNLDGLKPLPRPAPSSLNHFSLIRAAYQYQPDEVRSEAQLRVTVVPSEPVQTTWAWICSVDAFLGDRGKSRYVAKFELENHRGKQIQLRLPDNATLHGLTVDGKQPSFASLEGLAKTLDIVLPSENRFPVLVVAYDFPNDLNMFEEVDLLYPQLDIPVFVCKWKVWLPPEYAAASSSQEPMGWLRYLRAETGNIPFLLPTMSRKREPEILFTDDQWFGAQEVVRNLVALLGRTTALTWGQFFDIADREIAGSPLLIHKTAIYDAGIGPRTLIPEAVSELDLQRGLAKLRQAGIVVAYQPGGLLVTSLSFLARHQRHSNNIVHPIPFHRIQPGLLASPTGEQTPVLASEILTSQAWRTEPVETAWTAGISWLHAPVPIGWQAYQPDKKSGSGATVRVWNTGYWQLLSSCVCLFALAVMWQIKSFHRLAPLSILLVALMGLQLVSPPFSWLLMGYICGVLIYVTGRFVPIQRKDTNRPLAKSASGRSQLAVVIVFMLVYADSSLTFAQSDSRTPQTDRVQGISSVFVPVDDNFAPVGDYLHVPWGFFEALQQPQKQILERSPKFLLSDAKYQGTLLMRGDQPVIESLIAEFKVVVLKHTNHLTLPWRRAGNWSLGDSVLVDGIRQPLTMSKAGISIARNARAGQRYQVSFALRPSLWSDEDHEGYEIPLLVTPSSILQVTLPSNSPPVEIVSSGTELHRVDKTMLRTELGPTEKIILRWPRRYIDHGSNLTFEQLMWLHVRRGSVVLNVRFNLGSSRSSIDAIRLEHDSRLQLSPNPKVAGSDDDGEPHSGPTVLRVPSDPRTPVQASFLLKDTPDEGVIRLPELKVRDGQAVSKFVAVSIAPEFTFRQVPGEASTRIPSARFRDRWGPSIHSVDEAFRLSLDDDEWNISTRLRDAVFGTVEETSFFVDHEEVLVNHDVSVTTIQGENLRHQFHIPKALAIENVILSIAGTERRQTWIPGTADTITVFLSEQVDEDYRITLHGRYDNRIAERMPLPQPAILGSDSTERRMRLYRSSRVLLDVELADAVQSNESANEIGSRRENYDGFRLHTVVKGTTAESVMVRTKLNRIQATADLFSLLQYQDDSWRLEFVANVDVQEGLLDVLHFEVPDSLDSNIQLNSPGRLLSTDSVGRNRRRLRIEPELSAGKIRLGFGGELNFSSNDGLRAPDIVVLNVEESLVIHTLLLPRKLEDRRIAWTIRGLSPISWPQHGELSDFKLAQQFTPFRVVEPRFTASPQSLQAESDLPRIALADHSVRHIEQNRFVATSSFYVDPAGHARILVQLDTDTELIHATVGGQSALLRQRESSVWEIDLESDRLPQTIEIIYSGSQRQSWQTSRIVAPKVLTMEQSKIETETTLWTIPTNQVGQITAYSKISAHDQQLIRYEVVLNLFEGGVDLISENTSTQNHIWQEAGLARLSEIRSSFLPSSGDLQSSDLPDNLRDLLARQDELENRFFDARELDISNGSLEHWETSLSAGADFHRYALNGPMEVLEFRGQHRSNQKGFVLIASCIGLLLAIGVGINRPEIFDVARRWPHLFAVTLGVILWFWLSHGEIGFLLVLLALAGAFRSPWRKY